MNKRPIELNDLYRLRLISDARISPDGNRIAFVLKQMDEKKDDYLSNVYVVNREGTVTQFTSGDKDSTPRWSPDGNYLAFLSGRKERPQIHLLATAGGESIALTDRKLGAGVPVWAPDSKAIAFAALTSTDPDEETNEGKDKDRDKEDNKKAPTKIVERTGYKSDGTGYIGNRRSHLFLVRLCDRQIEQLTEGDFNDSGPAWSPDGRHLAFASKREDTWDIDLSTDIYVMPSDGGEARRLTTGGSYFSPVFSPDGGRIAMAGHEDPEEAFAPVRLYSMDRSGAGIRDEQSDWDGNPGNEMNSDCALLSEEIFLTWQTDGLYFLGSECGIANIYRSREGKVELVTEGRHTITDFSLADSGAIAYTCSAWSHPPEIFLQEDGQERRLTRENDAFLNEVLITEPERISFAGADGDESEGWLLAPRGHAAGKHPLLVYVHGGPHTAYGEVFFFEFQFLAGQGYGVFYPNIHGSSSYGRAYQTSIWRDWGNKDYADVIAGAEAAISREWVDPQRLGILGGSYGGYMTIWVLGHSDRFKAGITERCLCNFISFIGTSDGGWVWNRITGVYPEEDIQKLWDMSPLKYAGNVGVPLMVIHSEQDDRTPLEQGEQIFNTLRRLGKDTRFVRFPDESHGLSRIGKPSRRVERMDEILRWFREKL